jgi:hypothetical protein
VHDQATNALTAIALGSVLAVVLLIPVAAVQYRLDGRLGPKDLAILVSAAVYALALWTYTLLPMPAEDTYRCQGSQLRLFGSLASVRLPVDGPAALLRAGRRATARTETTSSPTVRPATSTAA